MMDLAKFGWGKWVLGGLGAGSGVTVALVVIEAVKERPEFLPQLLGSGGLWFAALILGMGMFRNQFASFNAMQERHVVAQEQLAQSVSALVSKDEETTREQELTLNHLARQSEQILLELKRIKGEPAAS